MNMKKKKNKERIVLFFEYGENMKQEYMEKLISSAKPVQRAYIPNAQITFTGKNVGRIDIIRVPNKKVYGVVYAIPFKRLASILRKASDYYSPCIVKTKIKMENGKIKKVLTIKSNEKNIQVKRKHVPPHGLHYIAIAEGYKEWHLNIKRLNKAIDQSF